MWSGKYLEPFIHVEYRIVPSTVCAKRRHCCQHWKIFENNWCLASGKYLSWMRTAKNRNGGTKLLVFVGIFTTWNWNVSLYEPCREIINEHSHRVHLVQYANLPTRTVPAHIPNSGALIIVTASFTWLLVCLALFI